MELLDAATGASLGSVGFSNVSDTFSKFAFAPDGKTIAFVTRYLSVDLPEFDLITVTLFDVATRKEIRQLGRHGAPVFAVAFSPDGKTLATGSGYSAQLWEVATGREVSPAEGHTAVIRGLAFSPDGKTLATASQDRTVRLWDVSTGRVRQRLGGHQGIVWCVGFSPDGRRVVSGSLDAIGNPHLENGERLHPLRVWDAATGRQILSWHANFGGLIYAVAFSPSGKELASLGPPPFNHRRIRDHAIEVWDPTSGKLLRRIVEPPAKPERVQWGKGMAYSPDGKMLAVTGIGEGAPEVWLLAASTGTVLRRLGATKGENSVYCLALSPDGRMLASGGPGQTVRLWEIGSGGERRTFDFEGQLRALAFSPDGRTLAAVGNGVTAWDMLTGERLARFPGQGAIVQAVAFSPDGTRLATTEHYTTAAVWAAPAVTRRPGQPLTDRQLDALWTSLIEGDAAEAYQAVWTLAGSPNQAVPFLGKHLKAIPELPAVERNRLARLLADLDSDRFAAREAAERELAKLGQSAEAALRKALAADLSPEARQRCERILAKMEPTVPTPEELRQVRAVEALEQIGSAEAREILRRRARGAPEAHLTLEAKAALERTAK